MDTEIRSTPRGPRAPRGPYKTSSPDRNAPLPLGFVRGVEHAKKLRGIEPHLSYKALACIMREYHGLDRSPSWWQLHLRRAGVPPRQWRGQYGSQAAA